MAGTFADQATLADTAAFIAKVKVAMLARAIEMYYSATAQDFKVLDQARNILSNGGSDAARMAALVVAGTAAIKAAAPAIPTDADTQAAVNTVLTALLK